MKQYSFAEAARILNLSRARLRYWQRTALVPCSPGDAGQPAFGFRDLVCIRTVLALVESGVPLRRIRRSVEAIRARIPEVERPLDALEVWADGSERVVVRFDGGLLEPDGQLVLDFQSEPVEIPPEVTRLRPVPTVDLDPAAPPDFERALDRFEAGCRLDADPARSAEAIEAYREAIEADPGFSDAWCNLGTVHYNRGERDLARGCYEQAIGREPTHVESNFNLANILEEVGEDDAALRHYRLALAVDPCYADLHLNLALLHDKLAQRSRALAHWRRYLDLAPNGNWTDIARQRLQRRDPQGDG